MTFDSLLSWLVLQPPILVAFLLLCGIAAIEMLIVWYRRRQPKAAAEPVPTGVKHAGDRPDQVAAPGERARMYPDGLVPLEWDGSPPRPNWNRRSGW